MRYVILLAALAAGLHAQPSCSLSFTFTGTGRSPAFSNKGATPSQAACNTWVIQFWVTGFSAAILEFDQAPDVAGSPGAWSLATGTPATGTNPLASGTSGIMIIQAYAAWFSINVNSVTGTGTGTGIMNGASGITARSLSASGANTFLSNLTSPTAINQPLLFSPDGTLDIGASGATRPRNLFLTGGVTAAGVLAVSQYTSNSNCASSSGACGSAPAGSVSIAAAASTVTVTTSAVHAASEILVINDATKGATLGVTCNTNAPGFLSITTITAGTSFVITDTVAPVTNPQCLDYFILN